MGRRSGAIVLGLLLLTRSAAADDSSRSSTPEPRGVPVRAEVLAAYGWQPGARISVPFGLHTRRQPQFLGPHPHLWTWFAGPGLAYYARPQDHFNLVSQASGGLRLLNLHSRVFSELALEVSHVARSQVSTIEVDLGSGDLSREREWQHRALVSAAYRLGQDFRDGWGWFFGGAGGTLIGSGYRTAYFSVGGGMQYRLGGSR